jgi:streptomycin 6-kinase
VCEAARVSITIPPVLARHVASVWGAEGVQWLSRLPGLLEDVARDWDLSLGEPYELSFHWVTSVTCADGEPAVLKLGVPAEHLSAQAEALREFGGQGAVRLLAYDAKRGALLLEHAGPGTEAATLVPERDEEATAALIDVGRRLHRAPPVDCGLPDLKAQGESFRAHLRRFRGDDPLPHTFVERAARLFDELCASAPDRVIIHGDLHHHNVLRASREPWLAIDPFGWIGDPGFDCGPMLYNPEPWRRDDDLLALVPARVEQLAAGFELPVERVVAWGFVMAVLSEVWSVEGGGTPDGRPLDVAALLYPRLP